MLVFGTLSVRIIRTRDKLGQSVYIVEKQRVFKLVLSMLLVVAGLGMVGVGIVQVLT